MSQPIYKPFTNFLGHPSMIDSVAFKTKNMQFAQIVRIPSVQTITTKDAGLNQIIKQPPRESSQLI